MISPAASPATIQAPEFIFRRLAEKLNDPVRRGQYEKWASDPETRENVRLLHDVFCRPADCPPSGEQAFWILGFNSGAWAICDTILDMIPGAAPVADPEVTYSDSSEQNNSGENTSKKGGTR